MDRGVRWSVGSGTIIALIALQMVAQMTVAAPVGDKITSLPGQPPVTFDQYSGYITVNETHGRKLFYYFTEAVNSSATAPLVLWLNGGPGCSSLSGGFTEQGPFRPNASGTGLTLNNASWNQVANVIFLESPAGVGFSYSNDTSDYTTNDEQTAQDSLTFLLGWLAEYPEYNSTDFYITGESYAGHYVPQLATAVVENNKLPGQAQINLKGVMIGNPLFDETIDLGYSPYEYGWGHGMMSEDTHNTIVKECNFSAPSVSIACENAVTDANDEIGENSPFLNPYDVLVDVCPVPDGPAQRLTAMRRKTVQKIFDNTSWPAVDACIDNEMTTYLNLADVETAMHTEVSGWSICSNSLDYSGENFSTPMLPLLAELLNSSVRVWVYSGDADIVIPLVGTRQLVNTLAKSLKLQVKTKYKSWLEGCQIGGWSISWESLVYSTVRGAGHMVPTFQPARALQLFTSFLAGDVGPPTDTSSCTGL